LKKSLVLTGMMGSGKSSVGKMLAQRLKTEFYDIDHMIEKKEKQSIDKIFTIKGEAYFRNLEKKITSKFLEKNGVVISLGGGAFLNPIIRGKILKTCASFWLHVNLKILIERVIKSRKRPLLNDKNQPKEMEKIFNERFSTYSLANYKINCSGIAKKVIVEKIIKIYEKNLS